MASAGQVNNSGEEHVCQKCGKTFSDGNSLRNHESIHSIDVSAFTMIKKAEGPAAKDFNCKTCARLGHVLDLGVHFVSCLINTQDQA